MADTALRNKNECFQVGARVIANICPGYIPLRM